MPGPPTQRRLAAIAVADVVGYSRLMEADETGTLEVLKERRRTIVEPTVRAHGGRIVKVMGDGVLIEFASAVNAVKAALELQGRMAAANAPLPEARHIVLRIGVNLGDVIGEGSDIYGDGVNIAARLEAHAEAGGLCISGKVLEEIAGKVTQQFVSIGDLSLKNISKPVHAYRDTHSLPRQEEPRRSGRTSIAVLPFDNLSGDPAQQYISDGITEDITTELARFSTLAVAARHAAFHYGGKGRNIGEAARQLGVTFMLEGSVRAAGERVRITAQLIDARSGEHLWAERYDRDTRDIFAIQDEVVSSIVAMLEGRVVAAEAAAAREKATASWSAYDCLLQGRDLCNRYREPESVPLFRRAVEIDPQFALAHAWLAIALTLSYVYGTDPRPMAEAERAAQRSVELNANEATCQWATALVLFLTGNLTRARSYFERALVLNPADIQIKGDYANWRRANGEPIAALQEIEREIAKGPFVPDWFAAVRGHILFDLKRYAEAVAVLESLPIHYSSAFLYLAASRAYLGDIAEAKLTVAKSLEFRPGLSSRDVAKVGLYLHESARKHLLEGLRLAGLPE